MSLTEPTAIAHPAKGPAVRLAEPRDASGMATMLAELLRDNVRDFTGRARVASWARGDLVLTASDVGISVTLSFRRGEIVVSDGATAGAAELAGPWMNMTKVCSGQRSPLVALARRELRITPGRGVTAVPAASFVLSVPSSFYQDSNQRKKRTATAIGLTATVATVLVGARTRRRRFTKIRGRSRGSRRSPQSSSGPACPA